MGKALVDSVETARPLASWEQHTEAGVGGRGFAPYYEAGAIGIRTSANGANSTSTRNTTNGESAGPLPHRVGGCVYGYDPLLLPSVLARSMTPWIDAASRLVESSPIFFAVTGDGDSFCTPRGKSMVPGGEGMMAASAPDFMGGIGFGRVSVKGHSATEAHPNNGHPAGALNLLERQLQACDS